jgi:hypothetical protein
MEEQIEEYINRIRGNSVGYVHPTSIYCSNCNKLCRTKAERITHELGCFRSIKELLLTLSKGEIVGTTHIGMAWDLIVENDICYFDELLNHIPDIQPYHSRVVELIKKNKCLFLEKIMDKYNYKIELDHNNIEGIESVSMVNFLLDRDILKPLDVVLFSSFRVFDALKHKLEVPNEIISYLLDSDRVTNSRFARVVAHVEHIPLDVIKHPKFYSCSRSLIQKLSSLYTPEEIIATILQSGNELQQMKCLLDSFPSIEKYISLLSLELIIKHQLTIPQHLRRPIIEYYQTIFPTVEDLDKAGFLLEFIVYMKNSNLSEICQKYELPLIVRVIGLDKELWSHLTYALGRGYFSEMDLITALGLVRVVNRRYMQFIINSLRTDTLIQYRSQHFSTKSEAVECDICLVEKRVFHACSTCKNEICTECSSKVAKCPFCRAEFRKSILASLIDEYLI